MAIRIMNVACCLVLLLLNIIIISMEKCHGELQNKNKNALFVFGDSLYDPGNNVYLESGSTIQTAHFPYGETYFHHPTGRFSDGRIVPDFIATFAGLPLLSAYLKPQPTPFTDGASFASGGAGVITTGEKPSIMLGKQFSYFKEVVESLKEELGDVRAQSVLENAVYLFSVGGNDYIAFNSQNPNATESSKRAYVYQVVSNLTSVFKEVYSLGGRKFGYQSVGPLGCTPISRIESSGDCDPQLMELATLHNQAFSNALTNLETQLPGFRYSLFDYYNALYDRINHPFKYGLKEGKVACCGVGPFRREGCGEVKNYELCDKPYEYVWFDSAHPVEEVNCQIANLIWSGPPNVIAPYNVKQLFGYY